MSERELNFYLIISFLLLFCLLTSSTILYPFLVIPSCLYARYKKKLTDPQCLFILHLLSSCFMVSTASPGWQERLSWFLVLCQGWILGLKQDFSGLTFSVTGKVVTLIWLNFFYGFDILSPNYIPYVPILVSRFFRVTDKSEENADNEMIVTDTHSVSSNPLFSLPFICKFEPMDKSPGVSILFYQSNGGMYTYKNKQYRVISLINGTKVYLQVEIIIE